MLQARQISLRDFEQSDAIRVTKLLEDGAVAKWTSNIPFPYTQAHARDWISGHGRKPEHRPRAILLDGEIIGCVSHWPAENGAEEVGYWVGVSYWGNGYCSRALSQLLDAPEFPATHLVIGRVMAENVASEKVLLNCGFAFSDTCTIVKEGREVAGKLFSRINATQPDRTKRRHTKEA